MIKRIKEKREDEIETNHKSKEGQLNGNEQIRSDDYFFFFMMKKATIPINMMM